MSEAVKIELTLERDTVEAFFKMISSLAASLSAQMSDTKSDTKSDMMSDKEENEEESNKEEVKEEIPIRINTSSNTIRPLSTSNTTNTNNNNYFINGGNSTNAIDLNTSAKDLNTSNNTSTNAEVTMDQILSYMSQKGYKFDPNKFYNYYRGMGWKTKNGKDIRPIWKETLDQWASYEIKRPSQKAATTPNKVGMGTREERMAAHPFVPTDFNEFAPV